MAPALGGGTQDSDFNKGFTKGIFTQNLRRRNGGVMGDPDPLILKDNVQDISTWIYEFSPGNKTIYVVFDEESEFSGPRTPNLSPDQVCEESVPYKNRLFNVFCSPP